MEIKQTVQLADQTEQKYLMLIISCGSISFMHVHVKVHFQPYTPKNKGPVLASMIP